MKQTLTEKLAKILEDASIEGVQKESILIRITGAIKERDREVLQEAQAYKTAYQAGDTEGYELIVQHNAGIKERMKNTL